MSAWSPHLPLKVTSWGLAMNSGPGGGGGVGWGLGVEWLTLTSLCLSQVSSGWVLRIPPPP